MWKFTWVLCFLVGWIGGGQIRKWYNSKEKVIKDIEYLCMKRGVQVPNDLESRHIMALKAIKENIKKQRRT